MKCLLSMVMAMLVGMQVSGAVALSNVKIQQRYPWNGKVDISFNLASTRTDIGIKFEALDTQKGEPVPIATIYKEDGTLLEYPYRVPAGKNHLVWDASADVIAGYKTGALAINITAGPTTEYPKYWVFDLSGGPTATRYPQSGLADVPPGGWTDEYKTTKMVFRFCPPGTYRQGPNGLLGYYTMSDGGASRLVTLTKPFYLGVFPVSRKQWELVMGDTTVLSSRFGSGDMVRATRTLYQYVRGDSKGRTFSKSYEVDENTLIGKLRAKTTPWLDLPSEAQWEYACKAGLPTDADGRLIGENQQDIIFNPNAWGIYEMPVGKTMVGGGRESCCELCIDWIDLVYGTRHVIDPVGFDSPDRNQGYHPLKGGSTVTGNAEWYSARGVSPTGIYDDVTSCRLAIWIERE